MDADAIDGLSNARAGGWLENLKITRGRWLQNPQPQNQGFDGAAICAFDGLAFSILIIT